MKYFIITTATVLFLTACGSKDSDSVKQAHEKNLNASIDEEISGFMTEAADARLMDIEEGKLAMQKGTNDLIKNYGEKMVAENTRVLKELRMLAASKNISLPISLSNKKADALNDLGDKTGQEFDQHFIKMMTKDHRRDVDAFEKATDFNDQDVRAFASKNLPVIESQLASLRQMEDSNKRITEDVVE